MRLSSAPLLLAAVLALPLAAQEAAPAPAAAENRAENATPEALAATVKTAFEARDIAAWKNNVHLDGLTPEEIRTLEETLAKIFSVKPEVRAIAVDTLPEGFDLVQVADGRRYTLTLKPGQLLGVINLRFGVGKSETELALPYGRVGDSFKLGTLRSEKLDWNGPRDTPHLVELRHTGDPDGVALRIRYEASGVKLEKRITGRTPRVTLLAQHIADIELERSCEQGETEMRIRRVRDAKDDTLFVSSTLAAPGRLTYSRELDTPAK